MNSNETHLLILRELDWFLTCLGGRFSECRVHLLQLIFRGVCAQGNSRSSRKPRSFTHTQLLRLRVWTRQQQRAHTYRFYHLYNDVDAANPSHAGDHLSDCPTDTEVRISFVYSPHLEQLSNDFLRIVY